MDSTSRDHPLLARQLRKHPLSPHCSRPGSITCYLLAEAIQIENAIQWQLQPKVRQWLATHPELSAADRKQIGHAIHAAYREGITTISGLKIEPPESIHNLLAEQEARSNYPRSGLEQQLGSWVKEARRGVANE